ncbi:MAG: protoheme IX farnesyltransferase [Proteobacteria bacterium]|nr:protoheme IX farnesyltransferase [Pseudomonadota bacterium]
MSVTQDFAYKQPAQAWRDYVQLTKPRITLFCLLMMLGGAAMAPESLKAGLIFFALTGTAFSVASANALNMYIERESDKLMKRTAARPLPTGRIGAQAALVFALILGVASVVILGIQVNWTTSFLSLFALLSYVLVYTPMKRITPHALLIGAVPGAMPPLLGWTAVTGQITAPGIVLFAILLIWQIPHFIAISVNHESDYRNAGIKTWPADRGHKPAIQQALIYSVLLIPVSLMLIPLGIGGALYGVTSVALGLWMVVLSVRGFNPDKHPKWAKQLFIASLVYLPVLTAVLAADLLLFK